MHRERLVGCCLALLLFAAAGAACGSSDDATSTPVVTASAVGTNDASSTPTPAFATPAAARSVTISAVGDISLAREVVDRMEANGADYPYALITPLLTGDIVIGNLEGALTEGGEPWPKGYNFRTPPRFVSGLADAGFDYVSLANNHAMDYGLGGLNDTEEALRAGGVFWGGAAVRGEGQGERNPIPFAQMPIPIERNGLSVAFISCVDTPTEGGGFAIRDWEVNEEAGGLFICDDEPLRQSIADARSQADFVVVLVHAGTEYSHVPDATQRRIAETALAAGADAYIGHHAHVVQPIEQRGPQLIAWGLGNFIFDLDEVDLANIPEPRMSLILNITLTEGAGVTAFEAVPVVQDANEDRPRPATAGEAAILQSRVD